MKKTIKKTSVAKKAAVKKTPAKKSAKKELAPKENAIDLAQFLCKVFNEKGKKDMAENYLAKKFEEAFGCSADNARKIVKQLDVKIGAIDVAIKM